MLARSGPRRLLYIHTPLGRYVVGRDACSHTHTHSNIVQPRGNSLNILGVQCCASAAAAAAEARVTLFYHARPAAPSPSHPAQVPKCGATTTALGKTWQLWPHGLDDANLGADGYRKEGNAPQDMPKEGDTAAWHCKGKRA